MNLSLSLRRNIFFACMIFCASGFVSPPFALAFGLVFGLSLEHPYAADTRSLTKFLLQASVILLGFGMDLHQVLRAGSSGFFYTAFGIAFALILGWALGKTLHVAPIQSFLIAAGTAICGGSAIAALGPVLGASEEAMAVALATVFVLNSVALLIFPPLGHWLNLSQSQFGLWAALAIHDTSSVVGAAAKYGQQALAIGTTVKLARALWIVPLALATAAFRRGQSSRSHAAVALAAATRTNASRINAGTVDAFAPDGAGTANSIASGTPTTSIPPKVQLPWFILFFVLACVLNTYLRQPLVTSLYGPLYTIGKLGLTVTLFLIGSGTSREVLRRVGIRPMVQGGILWLVVSALSLWLIRSGRIAI